MLLCQFLVLAGNRFWFYLLLMYLEYNRVMVRVVLVFWFWWEIVFCVTYVLRCTLQLCGCVSFLVSAGNNSQNENTSIL